MIDQLHIAKNSNEIYYESSRRSFMSRHIERHRTQRIGWLRAAVLGANDGIVSTASLMVGVAAASATPGNIMLTGVAGLVAGAMSMAAGEYVSVYSQADTEAADLARETAELRKDPEAERRELAAIYEARGLDAALAKTVAAQLMQHDAIGAHARDELGISETLAAQPIQAALASAASFAVGAALPLLVMALATAANASDSLIFWIASTSLAFLAALGVLAARAGGADPLVSAMRVTFWGAVALGVTAGVGKLFGTLV
jgi:vacuolar iron transporter family protein